MTAQHHYVCDRCGTYWNARFEEDHCRFCNHKSLWHFDRTIAALEHAAHIKERRAHQLEAVTPDKEKAGS